jgi:undecaprenyl-diphosphatase
MTVWEAIIFGIIQGITEFLPVSSSGHLVLAGKLLNATEEEYLFFFSMLHFGTLISVFIVMRKEIGSILANIFGKLTWLLVVATIPAVLAAIFLNNLIEDVFEGSYLWIAFIITGVILLSTFLVKKGKKDLTGITFLDAVIVGFAQAFAITPGVSRSGSCFSVLMLRGVKREDAIRFAFLMAIPAILGSFVLDVYHLISGNIVISSSMAVSTAVGIAVAALFGYLTMAFMIKKLSRKGIAICAAYVFALGIFLCLDQFFFHIVV